jgi:hypothetical protein
MTGMLPAKVSDSRAYETGDWSQAVSSDKIWKETGGNDSMSSPRDSWLDRWWPLLVISFGVSCVLWLALFHPHY